jgi:hypothetical protein
VFHEPSDPERTPTVPELEKSMTARDASIYRTLWIDNNAPKILTLGELSPLTALAATLMRHASKILARGGFLRD